MKILKNHVVRVSCTEVGIVVLVGEHGKSQLQFPKRFRVET